MTSALLKSSRHPFEYPIRSVIAKVSRVIAAVELQALGAKNPDKTQGNLAAVMSRTFKILLDKVKTGFKCSSCNKYFYKSLKVTKDANYNIIQKYCQKDIKYYLKSLGNFKIGSNIKNLEVSSCVAEISKFFQKSRLCPR